MKCTNCKKEVATKTEKVNHILHLLLTLLTAGFWLLVWILLSMTKKEVCVECGKPPGSSMGKAVLIIIIGTILFGECFSMKINDIMAQSPKGRKGMRRFWRDGEYFCLDKNRVISWDGKHWNKSYTTRVELEQGGVEYEQPNG